MVLVYCGVFCSCASAAVAAYQQHAIHQEGLEAQARQTVSQQSAKRIPQHLQLTNDVDMP